MTTLERKIRNPFSDESTLLMPEMGSKTNASSFLLNVLLSSKRSLLQRQLLPWQRRKVLALYRHLVASEMTGSHKIATILPMDAQAFAFYPQDAGRALAKGRKAMRFLLHLLRLQTRLRNEHISDYVAISGFLCFRKGFLSLFVLLP